ncbi:EthD family reductase [Alicyclobacillus ferrooxydans]|nr:EthD family reductase [Alicyclobacillus ferrooxydans]
MTALFERPTDVDAFLEHYENTHLPIVRRLPGLIRVDVCKLYTMTGEPADPFLMTDMVFSDREQLLLALRSKDGRDSGRDAADMAGTHVKVFFSEIDSEEFVETTEAKSE